MRTKGILCTYDQISFFPDTMDCWKNWKLYMQIQARLDQNLFITMGIMNEGGKSNL